MERDTVTVKEAAEILGTTKEKVARLVKQGILSSEVGVIDARRHLIPRAQLERLLSKEGRPSGGSGAPRKRPRTAGMYAGPLEVDADEVDEYLRRHWR
jgi:excisionase family DNA binding protein